MATAKWLRMFNGLFGHWHWFWLFRVFNPVGRDFFLKLCRCGEMRLPKNFTWESVRLLELLKYGVGRLEAVEQVNHESRTHAEDVRRASQRRLTELLAAEAALREEESRDV